MKKNFLLLAFFVAATTMTAFAAPATSTEPTAEQVFEKQFSGAENVEWSTVADNYKKVVFTWGGHRTEAYFNSNGEFVGAIRGLFYAQLPLSLIRSLDTQFKNHTVMEVREITNEEGTNYTITLEKKDRQYKVRVSPSGHVEDLKRIK